MTASKLAHIFITFLAIFAVKGAVSTERNFKPFGQAKPAAMTDYARPLSFEPNRGQTDRPVDFLAHASGYTLFLSRAEAVTALQNGAAVRMRPVGANGSAPAQALESQPSKSNYFIGSVPRHWYTNIPNYAKIRYRNVYAGIDLIYHGNQRQLEYDFVVKPGADPRRILLEFLGATKAELDQSGDLVMHTAAGDLRWHKPVAYQEINGGRKLVGCDYLRKGGRLGFRLAAYDKDKPLIIDPELEYSTYLGGSGYDQAFGVAVDADGSAYVTGNTSSANFPVKNSYQGTLKTQYGNAFVTKFDSVGKLVYSTYLGGSGDAPFGTDGDFGFGIAVDRGGNAYVTGLTYSPDFPTKNAYQQEPKNNDYNGNAFVTKLGASGSDLVYSTYLGGSGSQEGSGIAVDRHGSAYVAGETTSSDFPLKNAFQPVQNGLYDGFLTKFDPSGEALIYSTFLGGSGEDGIFGVALDDAENAYVTGFTQSLDFPTKNAFQIDLKGFQDAFVAKFDAAGTALVYSTYLGGSDNSLNSPGDFGFAIAVGKHNDAYVTGYTGSSDFPTKNAFQDELKSSYSDAFVTKFGPGGALVYSTYLGGSGGYPGDGGYGIAVDKAGRAYVTGITVSTDFPIKDAFQTSNRAPKSGNAFVTEFDVDGDALVYSSYLGGSVFDTASGIALDKHGDAYVVGLTFSADFPVTNNAFQPVFGGYADAFVTKISAK